MNRFLPGSDAALVAWGEKFTSVAGQNLATLKVTQAEVDEFANQVKAVKNALSAIEMLRAQSKGATAAKMTARGTMQGTASLLNLRLQGTAGISNALKEQLGITVRQPSPVRRRPLTPANLVVNGYQNGVNKLHWNRNGNVQGTVFVVEMLPDGAAAWTQIGTTLAARFDHAGQTPGARISYRVSAQRAETLSPPSNEAVVYASLPKAGLTLVKAA